MSENSAYLYRGRNLCFNSLFSLPCVFQSRNAKKQIHTTLLQGNVPLLERYVDVLNSKLAGQDDIDLLISGSLGDNSDIDEPDLVSILWNILDNSLKALTGTKKRNLNCFSSRRTLDNIQEFNFTVGSDRYNNELSNKKLGRKRH